MITFYDNLRLILSFAMILWGSIIASGQCGQDDLSSLDFIKATTGLRENLTAYDTCIIKSLIRLSSNEKCDTINSFLQRTSGLPNNSDGFTYGFSGRLRSTLYKELIVSNQCIDVLLKNLLILDPQQAPSNVNIPASFRRWPVLHEIHSDTAVYFPLLRKYLIEERYPITQQAVPPLTTDYNDGIEILKNLISTLIESTPNRFFQQRSIKKKELIIDLKKEITHEK